MGNDCSRREAENAKVVGGGVRVGHVINRSFVGCRYPKRMETGMDGQDMHVEVVDDSTSEEIIVMQAG